MEFGFPGFQFGEFGYRKGPCEHESRAGIRLHSVDHISTPLKKKARMRNPNFEIRVPNPSLTLHPTPRKRVARELKLQ